jgi:diguanylate cyclase (GGDEF)-like protein/PAS domain S-box-containing protein
MTMEPGSTINDTFFRQLVEYSGDLILSVTLDRIITYVSPSCVAILAQSPEELLGISCESNIFDDDLIRFQQAMQELIHGQESLELQYRYVKKDGTLIWLESKGVLIYDAHVPVSVGLISRDLSKHKAIEENLIRLAYYDTLTGLPNRRLFQDLYTQSLLTAKRYQRKLAVLYLDVDDFKLVNDNYGHAFGDELLQVIAARLSHCVRDPNTVCRLGGDEFVILLQPVKQSEDIEKVAQRVANALNNRFLIKQNKISITCSIGIAYYPQDQKEGSDLLAAADAAMYQAKKNRKNYIELRNTAAGPQQ